MKSSATHVAGNPNGPRIAWLQRNLLLADKAPARNFSANGVQIDVLSVNVAANQAVVRVRTDMPQRCLQGLVWREAGFADRVCVSVPERTARRNENALAAQRRQPGGGPFGPDTCR